MKSNQKIHQEERQEGERRCRNSWVTDEPVFLTNKPRGTLVSLFMFYFLWFPYVCV
jgi:hypothetical protein